MKKAILLIALSAVSIFATGELDDYYNGSTGEKIEAKMYPISQLSSDCHCQHYINEAFLQHTENDMNRQLYQMNIDQRNFSKHFLGEEMKLGLQNELLGINQSYNQSIGDLAMLDEIIFLTNKMNSQSEITAKSNRLIIKSNVVNLEK